MTDTGLSREEYEERRIAAQGSLQALNISPDQIRTTQRALADAGLYPADRIDGLVNDLMIYAVGVQADPFYARETLDALLTSRQAWTSSDITKAQIGLTSLGLYEGPAGGTMNEGTANGFLHYFEYSPTVRGGEISVDALRDIVKNADDQMVVQTVNFNPYIRIGNETGFQAELFNFDKPVEESTAQYMELSRVFGAAHGFFPTSHLNSSGSEYEAMAINVGGYTNFDGAKASIATHLTDSSLDYSEIWDLQISLNRLGYNVGRVDGSIGEQTATGMLHFLSDNPDAIDDISQASLAQLLRHADRDDIAAVFSSSPEFLRKLETDVANLGGASRAEMLSAQTRLQALGLYGGSLDGLIGRQTRAAVAGFYENMQSTYALDAPAEPGILARLSNDTSGPVRVAEVEQTELAPLPGAVAAFSYGAPGAF